MYSNDTIESVVGRARPRLARVRFSRLATLLGRLPASAVTWGCVVLGLLLLSPSLTTGLVADDYLH